MDKEKTNEITSKEMSSSFFSTPPSFACVCFSLPRSCFIIKKNAVSYDGQRNVRGGIIPWNEVSLWR